LFVVDFREEKCNLDLAEKEATLWIT